MILFPNRSTFIKIGSISIQWYAVLIIFGALLAYYLARQNFRKINYDDSTTDDYFIYMLWCGIIGARLWYCLFYNPGYYFSNPLKLLAIYEGGLAIHGGLIGGFVYTLYYCHKKNIDLRIFADNVLPNVLLAQAIGRWGNFFNQEAYGPVVSAEYFNYFPSFIKEGMYIGGSYHKPMFLYESILDLTGFLLLNFVLKKHKNKNGDLAYAYLMWYGMIRFFIEFQRDDALYFGQLRIAQIVSLIGFICGMLGYLGCFEKFFKKRKPTVLFDLDGTLVDTQDAILTSFQKVFDAYGKGDFFRNEVNLAVIGPSLEESFRRYLPQEDCHKLISLYRQYNNEALKNVKAMPNAIDICKILKANGIALGVVSVRHHTSVEYVLDNSGLKAYIDDFMAGDDVKKLKPDIEGIVKIITKNNWNRDDVCYVGDSASDIKCGKNYGAYTVGYYFENNRKAELDKENADDYISDLKELIDLLNKKYGLNIFN